MNTILNTAVIALVCLSTALMAVRGVNRSRSSADVLVAARSVRPWWNASAIGGEYLSAASFLGVTGLIVLTGRDGLWYPVGYAAGFLMLMLFVAAPLRRSGAYTLPDFAQVRFGQENVARVLGYTVLGVGWLYMLPQMHAAALALITVTDLPAWVGPVAVTAVVIASVVPGGMRSITAVQAMQYWLKLAALAIPTIAIIIALPLGAGPDLPTEPVLPSPGQTPLVTVSLLIALVFGTLGLPHVLVRFYTNPTGAQARTTTFTVTGLVSLFYLFPTALAFLAVSAGITTPGNPDALLLELPSTLLGGTVGVLLTAIVAGGAFAAFVSTSSGLTVALAGVISRRFFAGSVSGFRRGALLAALVPGAISMATSTTGLASVIGSIFALTASTIAPVLLAGIWWRRASGAGAIAAMVTGASVWLACLVASFAGAGAALGGLVGQPGLLSVPAAVLALIVFSLARPDLDTGRLDEVLARLHAPNRD
ncbi:MAG: sodium/solute symporter [Galactobacter sp.]